MLLIANLSAQTPTTPVVTPVTTPGASTPVNMPDRISIGEMAVVEALAKAKSIYLICGSASTFRPFEFSQPLGDVDSIDDINKVIERIQVDFVTTHPKEQINLAVRINDVNGMNLFRSDTSFQLEKVYDGLSNRFVYNTPYYAGNVWFNLNDSELRIPGAVMAHMVNRNGDIYQLNVFDGRVQIPGWMNRSGEFSELVVDGVRYDMNTGIRLGSSRVQPNFLNVDFSQVQRVEYTTGLNSIYAAPQYGYIPNTEIKPTNNQLRLQFQAGEWNWVYPISVYIATLDDLKSGGKGWKVYPYFTGMIIPVVPGVTYYIWPEYQDNQIGSGVSTGDRG